MTASLPVRPRSNHWRDVNRRVIREVLAQWLWFVSGISPSRVGHGRGLLTWVRSLRHALQRREVRVCLVTLPDDRAQFGELTAWTINQRSRICSASVNTGLDQADIIWVYAQDPIENERRADLEKKIRSSARADAKVINKIGSYNAYHQSETFEFLSRSGVSVPRYTFTEKDVGLTRVIYKQTGCQASPKRNVVYAGAAPGMRAFEFIDSATPEGLYRRFRAYYILGLVRPSEVLFSDHWNVCLRNALQIQYGFEMTKEETRQIKLIAELLELDYFAVDFVRRGSDDRPFFTDINVYPAIRSPTQFVEARGDIAGWHTFDACTRLGLEDPLGGNFWDHFDQAIQRYLNEGVAIKVMPFGTLRRPTHCDEGSRPSSLALRLANK